jgi:molybdenum cofactor synthesis domain-containing protein
MSLLDCQVAVLANQALNYLVGGKSPQRLGNAHPNIVPYQTFETKDGHIIIAIGTDRQFREYCTLIGTPALPDDPRFATNRARVENRDALIALLIEPMKRRNTGEWIDLFEPAAIPCGPINSIEEVVLATLHTNRPVTADLPVAGTRIIPLFTTEEKVVGVADICNKYDPVIEAKQFQSLKVGLVTTGNEIYHGRIEDKFGPVVRQKFAVMGSKVIRQIIVPDDVAMTVTAIHELLASGAEMIVATGGMSVDPDDRTPAAIRSSGGEVVTYGSPTFPGSMFMLSYIGNVPVIGLPGCAMYNKATVFELIVPRILAGERVRRSDIVTLGHGGFCEGCPECRYPNCSFGK